MGHKALFSAAMLFGRAAKAAYNEFTFTNEASKWTCPGMNFACSPPSICTFDTLLQKSVCCGSGGQDEVCWNESTQCGTNTVSCGDGDNSFCCLTDREICTQRTGQINICWATAANPVANVSHEKMNDTFSSLSSQNPSATLFTVQLAAITATRSSSATSPPGSSTSSSSSAPSSTSSTTSSAAAVSSTSAASNDSGISAGAIGGAVVGGVAGLALIGVGIFFFLRRRRAGKSLGTKELDGNPYAHPAQSTWDNGNGTQKYAYEAAPQKPVEMPVAEVPREMEGSQPTRL